MAMGKALTVEQDPVAFPTFVLVQTPNHSIRHRSWLTCLFAAHAEAGRLQRIYIRFL